MNYLSLISNKNPIMLIYNLYCKIKSLLKNKFSNRSFSSDINYNENELLYFHNLNISEVMIPRTDIIAALHDSTYLLLKETFIKNNFHYLLVYDKKKQSIFGYIDIIDLLMSDPGKSFNIQKIIKKPFYSPKSIKFVDLLLNMKKRNSPISVILDEYGDIEGIVTEERILQLITYDISNFANNHLNKDNTKDTYVFDAKTPMHIVEENLNISIINKETNFDTVGGFILHYLNRIPKTGEFFKHPTGINVYIIEANSRRIIKVKISKI